MSHRTLDDLSSEILQEIGAYLYDTHLPSLHSLALVNKACHAAAAVWLFRTLRFNSALKGKLELDVAQRVEILSSIDGFKHVRIIRIEGCGQDHSKGPGLFTRDSPVEVGREEDEAWLPLVGLLQKLPRLSDLIFDCQAQFPPSLLDALHRYQPGCRLHIMHFRFRSLLQEVPYQHEVDIAASPCLHSVRVHYTHRDSDGKDDFNEEAIRRVVASLAPNLKEVWMLYTRSIASGRLYHSRGRPRSEWKGFPGFSAAGSRGSLTSLSLSGSQCVLQGWENFTDFESLRHLHLSYLESNQLGWIVDNVRFSRLETLEIYLPSPPEIEQEDDEEEDDDRSNGQDRSNPSITRFSIDKLTLFSTLPPLQSLTLYGYIDDATLVHALQCHGNTLRKLQLFPSRFSPQDPSGYAQHVVSTIQESCPNLKELTLPVRRSFSDRKEIGLYKTLGSIARLRSLVLTLDVSVQTLEPRAPSSPFISLSEISDEVFERERGQIRKGLLNAAIDETLARSIWDVMTDGATRSTLVTLVLRPYGGGVSYGGRGILSYQEVMIRQLSRSFRVEKSPRDDDDSITVTDLDKDVRDATYEREEKQLAERNARWREQKRAIPRNRIMEVFRSIWPAKESSRDWRDDWTSLPLDRGVETFPFRHLRPS